MEITAKLGIALSVARSQVAKVLVLGKPGSFVPSMMTVSGVHADGLPVNELLLLGYAQGAKEIAH